MFTVTAACQSDCDVTRMSQPTAVSMDTLLSTAVIIFMSLYLISDAISKRLTIIVPHPISDPEME